MATITQVTNTTQTVAEDLLSNGGQLGGSTLITGASGTIDLGSFARIDSVYYVTTTAATTLLMPASSKHGYRSTIVNAAASVGTITVRNAANTLTIGPVLSPGNTLMTLRTAAADTWAPVAAAGLSSVRVATFSATSDASGNGTLSIASLGLATAPLAVVAVAYSPTNDCYSVALKSKTATTVTFETYDNLIGILIGGVTAAKQANVAVDFVVHY